MTFVYVLRSGGREGYELRRNESRRGKKITREEAEEPIAPPGTARARHVAFTDGFLSEAYELGGGPA